MLLSLFGFAAAADLTIRVQPPGATAATTIVLHDLEPGRLPTVELPEDATHAWRLGMAYAAVPDGARLGFAFERTTLGVDGRWRVEPGVTHLVDVGTNSHTRLAWGEDHPVQGTDGRWGLREATTDLEVRLDDGTVPTTVLPADHRLDLHLAGWDQPTVRLSILAPAEGAQPVVEVPTGARTVRRVAVAVAPTGSGHSFAFALTDATRRGKKLLPGESWTPTVLAPDNTEASFAHGHLESADRGVRVDAVWVDPDASSAAEPG